VGAILNGMGLLYQHTDRLDEALATLEEAIVWQAKALAAHPGHSPYNQFLNSHMGTHVRTCQGLDNAEVGAAYERVLAILEPPRGRTRRTATWRAMGGDVQQSGGSRSALRGARFTKAREVAQEAVQWQGKALAGEPGDSRCNEFMERHLSILIEACQGAGDEAGAGEARARLAEHRRRAPGT
jgi:hypothetical protein